MYNLTVDTAHTYFVGEDQWLVHNACKPKHYDIVPYKTNAPGFEKHHGVLNKWAEVNIPNYNKYDAPTIVLSNAEHNATRSYFGAWAIKNTGGFGRAVDWAQMSFNQAKKLSDEMFKYAKVPQKHVNNYYRKFNAYLDSIK